MGIKGITSDVNVSTCISSYNMIYNERNRTKLFDLWVIYKHTKIDTLINSGSEENLIFEDIVKKLGLENKLHPNPYSLGWVTKDVEPIVTE